LYSFFQLFNQFEVGRIFEEWVIGCKALTKENNPIIYYVSRGNIQNSIFVYTENDSDLDPPLTIYNYFNNSTVVDGLMNFDDEDNSDTANTNVGNEEVPITIDEEKISSKEENMSTSKDEFSHSVGLSNL